MKTQTVKALKLDKYSLELYPQEYLLIRHKSNVRFELEDAIEQVKIISDFSEGERYPFVIDLRVDNWDAPKAVKDFHAKNKDLLEIRAAEAIVVNNLGLRILANFYQKFHQTDNPIKVFNNLDKAIEWAKKHY